MGRNQSQEKKRLFPELAADLRKVRPDVADLVVCPLCVKEFPLDLINKLSVEHVVSSKLDGRITTLTCISCNNRQGTKLDANLVRAMKAMDGLEGTEPIKTLWQRPEGRVIANTLWRSGAKDAPITSRIVGAASHPAGIEGIRAHLRQRSSIDLTLNFDFIPEQYWKAAVRSAYLAVFCAEGYEYVFSDGGSQARSVIDGTVPVNPNVIMEAFPDQEPPHDILVMPHAFNDIGGVFAVLLRLKTQRTRYLNVYLPGKAGCDWTQLGTFYKHAPRLRIETTPNTWTAPLHISFGYDPVSELRNGNTLTKLFSTPIAGR